MWDLASRVRRHLKGGDKWLKCGRFVPGPPSPEGKGPDSDRKVCTYKIGLSCPGLVLFIKTRTSRDILIWKVVQSSKMELESRGAKLPQRSIQPKIKWPYTRQRHLALLPAG